VKCGSEKPACTNCVKYRCTCVYMPSVRHMRPRAHAPAASGSVTKSAYRQRKQCVALEIAGSGAARAARSVSADSAGHLPSPLASRSPVPASAGDGLSLSQLMKPVAPRMKSIASPTNSVAPPMNSVAHAVHMQIAATAPLQPPTPQYPQPFPQTLAQYSAGSHMQMQSNPSPAMPLSLQQPQQTMALSTLAGSHAGVQPLTARTLSPPTQNKDRQSISPLASSAQPWRQQQQHLAQSAHPDSPRTRQRLPAAGDDSAEAYSRGISDILRELSLPSAAEPAIPPILERFERSASMAASVSSLGSATHSPAFSNVGIDPKQIEASLPQPAPDTLDNMLKAYFRYQYPSSGIVLEEFFWFR
ncbi:hypothetical protein GGF43_006648, partial [Coemansia sp. RSA 2618]